MIQFTGATPTERNKGLGDLPWLMYAIALINFVSGIEVSRPQQSKGQGRRI